MSVYRIRYSLAGLDGWEVRSVGKKLGRVRARHVESALAEWVISRRDGNCSHLGILVVSTLAGSNHAWLEEANEAYDKVKVLV